MDSALDYITRLWPAAVGFVGVVAWLVRVDSRTMNQANELARVEREGAEELARLEKRIDDRRREDMGRIESQLSTVSQDIKILLQRGK